MRTPARMRAVAALAALALALPGCDGDPSPAARGTGQPEPHRSDTGAVPYERVPAGGTLQWPLDAAPLNLNAYHIDGANPTTTQVVDALLPRVFRTDAAGVPHRNADYLAAAESTAGPVQTVRYRIHPRAVWTDGTPITWRDFRAQWRATNGTGRGYDIASAHGYDRIARVEPGGDERTVVVTFRTPFADWQSLFSPLYPAATNADPVLFNNAWRDAAPVTAGPFAFGRLDRRARTITVVRNPAWWGRPARLDRIVFRVVDRDAQPDALAADQLDWIDVGADPQRLARIEDMAGVTVRRAPGPAFRQLTFNGGSPVLRDVTVRTALAKGIDRARIAATMLDPFGLPGRPLGNHLLLATQDGYQDNSGGVGKYDPAAAGRLLDAAGWRPAGPVRVKGGRPLSIRFVIPDLVPASRQEAELVRDMLRQIGAEVDIRAVPADEFFDRYVGPGSFDLTAFSWVGGAYPMRSARPVYTRPRRGPSGVDVRQNYARTGTAEIDALFDRVDRELDRGRALDLVNSLDSKIWRQVHSVATYQRPQVVAVDSRLVNLGAGGLADRRYEEIGLTR